jgi:hypothetical protein
MHVFYFFFLESMDCFAAPTGKKSLERPRRRDKSEWEDDCLVVQRTAHLFAGLLWIVVL